MIEKDYRYISINCLPSVHVDLLYNLLLVTFSCDCPCATSCS